MARLKPGMSSAQAASATSAAFAAGTTNGPDAMFKPADAPRIELSTAARGLVTLRQNFSQPLFVLLAGVGIILLISCANIAGLMLARSAARRKELAMRIALGATRARILRQLFTESLLLSLTGGAIGILLGYLGAGALASFLSHNWYRPLQVDVRPDAHVLAFTVLVSVLVGVAFGLAPVFSSRRLDLVPAVKETCRQPRLPGDAGLPSAIRWLPLKLRLPCWFWRARDCWFAPCRICELKTSASIRKMSWCFGWTQPTAIARARTCRLSIAIFRSNSHLCRA